MSQAGMMTVTKVWHVTVIGRVSHITCHETNSNRVEGKVLDYDESSAVDRF